MEFPTPSLDTRLPGCVAGFVLDVGGGDLGVELASRAPGGTIVTQISIGNIANSTTPALGFAVHPGSLVASRITTPAVANIYGRPGARNTLTYGACPAVPPEGVSGRDPHVYVPVSRNVTVEPNWYIPPGQHLWVSSFLIAFTGSFTFLFAWTELGEE